MHTADITASISLYTTDSGLHGYTVQTAQGSAMRALWPNRGSAYLAACDAAVRLGETGMAIVFIDDGARAARIALDCPPSEDQIVWRPLAGAHLAA
jgi:hypothetical protein